MEDLIHLERSTDHLREAAQELLTRLKLTQSDKMQIKDILDKCITDFAEARGQHRGWGRKYRLSSTISSIIDNSRERLRNCKSFHDAESSPIAPSPHIAIALDLLERASRTILYNDPEIRRRDGVAESATVTMFNEFLNLARRQEAPITMTGTDIFSKSIHDDFYHWLEDYRNEITKETEEDGCISAPAMRQAASPVMDLWRKVQPAVAVVDYISEMTDRFVIHEVFAGHDLQKTLLSTFDGAYLRQMRA
jgi:dGTP triphosphohydrolase